MSIAFRPTVDVRAIPSGRRIGVLVLSVVAVYLLGSGLVALTLGVTRTQLAPDIGSLSISYQFLCSLAGGRVDAFMSHDRTAFGGAVMADAVMYLWLVNGPVARGERWATIVLALSGAVGFASLLSFFGTRYVDGLHAVASLAILPPFVIGLVLVSRSGPRDKSGAPVSRPRVRPQLRRRALIVLTGIGLVGAGLVIATIGSFVVFVPQDVGYLGLDRAALDGIDRHLVPLIAHDRAAFGAALGSTGIAVTGAAAFGRSSRGLPLALAGAGAAGFGAALGTHLLIGYLDVVHLTPGVVAVVAFVMGMAVWRPWVAVEREPSTIRQPL